MDHISSMFPDVRLRRLRSSAAVRAMTAAPMPGPEKFIWPVFIVPGRNIEQPIDALPGQFRYSPDRLADAVEKVKCMGVNAVMLFGVPNEAEKTPDAAAAYRLDGIVQAAIRLLKERFGNELVVFTDVCICGYASHGHCGVLDASNVVDNDSSLDLLTKIAASHAESGADCVAPSAMLDGQVAAIRQGLDSAGYANTMILSYAVKFASALYAPFRKAADSAPAFGSRKEYQADHLNSRTALREALFDAAEGADMLMVKPALFYLDIIAAVRKSTLLPLAAYNVSGEYAMLTAAAASGQGDLKPLVRESIAAISRAGADIIISYWANQYKQLLKD